MHGIKFMSHLAGNQSCVFGNSRHRKFYSHNVVYSLQNMHLIWLIVPRMRSFHAGIHKRTFGLKRQGLCLFNENLENYATSQKLTSKRKQLQLYFGATWQNIWFSKLGGKRKPRKVQIARNTVTQMLRLIILVSQTACHCFVVCSAQISGG